MPLATLLLLAAAQAQHDPPVIRCAFEDRSRMVLFNPTPGLWMAFNPTTCTLQKVWEGDVEWKGKVFDFSQDNSKANGKVLYEAPSTLVKLEDGRPGDWKLTNVTWKDGWNFAEGGSLESPVFDPGWEFARLCVMFDETSRKGSVRAEIVGIDGQTQSWFDSTKHGHSDTDWQFNMKLLPDPERKVKLRISQPGDFGKKLKNVRVFADYKGWWTADSPIVWRGYKVSVDGKSLTCMMQVKGYHYAQEFGADKDHWWINVTSTAPSIQSVPPAMMRMSVTKAMEPFIDRRKLELGETEVRKLELDGPFRLEFKR